jgi:hypothetical protein
VPRSIQIGTAHKAGGLEEMLKVATILLMLATFMVPARADTLEGYKGDLYVGAVLNGVPHGKGVKTWPNGHRYEGDWNNGEREGKGTYTWPSGESYKGEWRKGKWHGQGVYTKPEGTTITGEFKSGNFWNVIAQQPDGTRTVWKNGFGQ